MSDQTVIPPVPPDTKVVPASVSPVVDTTPDLVQPVAFANTELPDVLELRNVGVTYDGGKKWVIKGCNLLIEDVPNRGQIDVILGASGCGKSTLLRFFTGLQKPTVGEVLIKGNKLNRRDAIAMVFQQYSSLPHLTVLENVELGLKFRGVAKKERQERAMVMIQKVGLEGHEHKFAQYPTLSGGQLQRVAIARSMMANPEIFMMDEPFGALDTKTRRDMQLLVSEMYDTLQPTIVFVTHDIAEAVFLADRIHIMRANPGMIWKTFAIDLPDHRGREIFYDQHFIEQVRMVEDALLAVQATSKVAH